MLNHGDAANGAAARRLLLFFGVRDACTAWASARLTIPIALAALVIGIGIVMLVALNI
jgi:hypothetical protein